MKKIILFTITAFVSSFAIAQPCSDLYFSEYLEGSSNNKALEIYNSTASAVDLSEYVIYRANNGATTPSDSIIPIGMLAAGEVFVIANPSADSAVLAVADTTHSITFYNGDDALWLMHGSDTLDIIGEIGIDPGSSWTVGSGATNEYTLVRKMTVQEGTIDWSVSVNEWDVYPQNTFSFLGAHSMTACGAAVDTTVSFTSNSVSVSENTGTINLDLQLNVTSSTGTHSVDVLLASGDSSDVGDYTTQTITFDSTTTESITVTITNDTITEPDEVFVFQLINPSSNLFLGSDSLFTLTIQANDVPVTPQQPCSDLFFSEYIEGSSSNKALEIFNASSSTVDLSEYMIYRANNGGTTPSDNFGPVGMLAAGDVYVIANPSADSAVLAVADTTHSITFYNGDDALWLMHGSDTLDIIGEIGVDPGSGWTVGAGATNEYTLVRNMNTQLGTTNWSMSVNQWDVYPQNTFSFLGSHSMTPCGPVVDTLVSFSTTAMTVEEDTGIINLDLLLNLVSSTGNFSVDVALVSGDSSDIGNFTTQTITFDSTTMESLPLTVTDDTLIEGDETFVFQLMNPSTNLLLGMDSIFTLTINANDSIMPPVPPAVNFSPTSMMVQEDAGTVDVDLILDASTNTDSFSVDVILMSGDASDVGNFVTQTIIFDSTISESISITITDDTLNEGPEVFVFQLANPTGSLILGADSLFTLTIKASDAPVTPGQPCSDLFFSEYLEGSSNNKALELYNPTANPVNLSDYTIYRANNGATTPSDELVPIGMLAAGAVYVIANPSADSAIMAVADTTSTITFYNGDDALWLMHGADTLDIIGEIGVDPGSSWQVGSGATNENTLVRKATVQQGTTNWTLSAGQWDVYPQNTFSFIGNHTMNPCGPVVDTLVSYSLTSRTVQEDAGTVDVNLVLNVSSNPSNFSVDVMLASGDPADVGNYTAQTVTFNGTTQATLMISITNDTLVEGDETFTFVLTNPTGNLMVGADSIFTLKIVASDQPVPFYPIATIRGNNTDGIPDSIGVKCMTGGVVYGVNLNPSGLSFTINDKTAGIGIFTPSSVGNFGYTVNEGDSVIVVGQVDHFNGLGQMEFLDTLALVGTGSVPAPVVVTSLNESTESELVKIENVYVTDTISSTASGTTFEISNGSQTFDMRIDVDINYMGTIPALFNVTGIGGQYDFSAPYADGYQILPRRTSDIEEVVGIEELSSSSLSYYPNPVGDWVHIVLDGNSGIEELRVFNVVGKKIRTQQVDQTEGILQVNLQDLQKGIYILQLTGSEGSYSLKIVKQ